MESFAVRIKLAAYDAWAARAKETDPRNPFSDEQSDLN